MSSVTFTGLTRLMTGLSRAPDVTDQHLSDWTKELGDEFLQAYQDNLSGSSPSTADSPLPVGIRTGELIAGATLTQTNQFSFQITNTSDHAGEIEYGTSVMAPRRPLQDVIDKMGALIGEQIGEVQQSILEDITSGGADSTVTVGSN